MRRASKIINALRRRGDFVFSDKDGSAACQLENGFCEGCVSSPIFFVFVYGVPIKGFENLRATRGLEKTCVNNASIMLRRFI